MNKTDEKTERTVLKWEEKKVLRENFVKRAYRFIRTNKGARSKLAKCFGESISRTNVNILSLLFLVMEQEEYEAEYIRRQNDTTLDAYFFVLTMMAYFEKEDNEGVSDIKKEWDPLENKLKKLYETGSQSTKDKIQKLLGKRFGDGGLLQKELARITKLIDKKDMNNINYFKLLQDLCEWNTYGKKVNGSVSDVCYSWSRKIFLSMSLEETKEEE